MKNKIWSLILLLSVFLGFTACGGGGGGGSTSSTPTYDFYAYLVSDKTITKRWDNYIFNSTGGLYSTSINIASSIETITSPSSSTVVEDETINYSLLNNSILALNGTETASLKRYLTLGDKIVTDFKLIEHIDTYTPYDGYIFNDVIKVEIDFNDGTYTYDYYAKNFGKVVTTSNYSIGTNSYTSVSIVNNY